MYIRVVAISGCCCTIQYNTILESSATNCIVQQHPGFAMNEPPLLWQAPLLCQPPCYGRRSARRCAPFVSCQTRLCSVSTPRTHPSAASTRATAKRPRSHRGEFRRSSLSAAEAKKLGRQASLLPDWKDRKIRVMAECVRSKFNRSSRLRNELVATGQRQLVEGTWWCDQFWGVCCGKGEAHRYCRGRGENHLGKILMRVREELAEPGP